MHWRSIALGGWGLVMLMCVPAMARSAHDAHGGNCVAYARELTGIHLDGDAASWWPHAEGRYQRGHTPQIGAVLVFKPYGRMRVGHVAVVSRVVNSREVLVDQANWVRGRVTKAISVVDVSAANDWTSVKVQYAGTHGRDNPTYGFIYPQAPSIDSGPAVADDARERHHTDRVAAHVKRHNDTDAQEAAEKSDAPAHHVTKRTAPRRHEDDTAIASTADPALQPAAERAKPRRHRDDTRLASAAEPAPQHAEHAAHHRAASAQDEPKTNAAQPGQRSAAAKLPVHKRKLPDAQLAYVY